MHPTSNSLTEIVWCALLQHTLSEHVLCALVHCSAFMAPQCTLANYVHCSPAQHVVWCTARNLLHAPFFSPLDSQLKLMGCLMQLTLICDIIL